MARDVLALATTSLAAHFYFEIWDQKFMELVCPAGNFPSLKAAIDSGADAVYLGLQDDTNARHFPGLNFNQNNLGKGVQYAHARGSRVFMAINTYAQNGGFERWQHAVDTAADAGVDALIIADLAVLDYAASHHPDLSRHLSVQGSATNTAALRFYHNHFGIKRAVLPRVLSIRQVASVAEQSPVDLEVFGFGSLCIMVEGRCLLSSYVTGESPNLSGVCSPAKFVNWEDNKDQLKSRLNGVLIDRFEKGENAGYPTLCKGRFNVEGKTDNALEQPTSLNTLQLVPELQSIGIKAIKIEGRQRSPAYVSKVTKVWRQALDAIETRPADYHVRQNWIRNLASVSEGTQTTLGAYDRPWL